MLSVHGMGSPGMKPCAWGCGSGVSIHWPLQEAENQPGSSWDQGGEDMEQILILKGEGFVHTLRGQS